MDGDKMGLADQFLLPYEFTEPVKPPGVKPVLVGATAGEPLPYEQTASAQTPYHPWASHPLLLMLPAPRPRPNPMLHSNCSSPWPNSTSLWHHVHGILASWV